MYYLLFGIPASIGLFAYYVSTLPAASRIARSATVDAPPEVLFGLISDFHEWAAWSPWEKMDPAMKKTFEGPASGVGSVYRWVGNSKVGEGSMTLAGATPSRIDVDMAFIKPFPNTSKVSFTLTPEGSGTKITWAMEAERTFILKAFGVFMNMDELVGKDFQAGLAAMKTAAQAKTAKAA